MAKKKEKKKSSSAGALIFCAIAAYLALGHSSTMSGTTHNSTCKALEKLWVHNGGSSSTSFLAAEIAMAESSGSSTAVDHNKDGSVDRGYWQINSVHGALSTFNPNGNAKAAIKISNNGKNWSAWVTYQKDEYQGRCLYVLL